MLPKNLSDIIENHDPEDFDIIITKAQYDRLNLKFDLQLSVITQSKDWPDQTWVIVAKQYRKSRILFEPPSTLKVFVDHPLLWPFSDNQSEVYFHGNSKNKDQLYLDLYKAHQNIFHDLLPFEDTLNTATDFFKLTSTSTGGLLANGPQKLLNKYAEILTDHKLQYSIVGNRKPTFWNGKQHLPETGNARILLIDNSFIIADEFHFSRQ